MEVDISWLEAEPSRADPSPGGAGASPPRPPPLADAALRHPTLEVAPEWLQVDEPDATHPGPPAGAPPRERSQQEPGDQALRRARPPWQPPTLPPPPAVVARRPARGGAAPIPREDTPSEPPPSRRRHPVR